VASDGYGRRTAQRLARPSLFLSRFPHFAVPLLLLLLLLLF